MLPVFKKNNLNDKGYLEEFKKADDKIWRVLVWLTVLVFVGIVVLARGGTRLEERVPQRRSPVPSVVRENIFELQ